MNIKLGVDLDNTLINYEELFRRVAAEEGLLSAVPASTDDSIGKTGIREAVRALPNGEFQWQKLQGLVYGARIKEAQLISGVRSFFGECTKRGVPVYIVSHKTKAAHHDDTGMDLQKAAMGWMSDNEFFTQSGMGLSQDQVFFEVTRADKLQRIQSLQCTHFIDDLEEIFADEGFPEGVTKILYQPTGPDADSGSSASNMAGDWDCIRGYIFD
jgi:hypothetical protein